MHRRPYRIKIYYVSAMWRMLMLLFHRELPRKVLSWMGLCRLPILEVQVLIQLLFLRM